MGIQVLFKVSRSMLPRTACPAVLAVYGLLGGCSGDETASAARVCEPGATRICVGDGACSGGQACAKDGMGWGACDCSGAADAGGGTGGAPADSGIDSASGGVSGGGGAPSKCPQGKGPTMIDVGPFCIDRTQVTQKQYDEFLQTTKVKFPTQPVECAKNLDFNPDPFCIPQYWDPINRPEHAAVCLNWCDARMYCEWAGKRLCGAIGGGPLASWAQLSDPNVSQWNYACSQGGNVQYPYGGNSLGFVCNVTDKYEPVASRPACVSGTVPPFTEVFDLLAAPLEWVDSCSPQGGSFACSFYSPSSPSADCTTNSSVDILYKNGGFRCCSK